MVANDAGDRVTPAVVAYSENEEVLFPSYFCFEISKNYMHCNILLFFQVVGLAAKQSRIRNISNTVMKVKQILGRRYGIKYYFNI